MAQADMIAVPGKPGQFFIPSTGRVQKVYELYADAVIDTVELPSGAQTQDTRLFFNNLTNKKPQHANVITQARLPSHYKMKLLRIGVYIRQVYANSAVPALDTLKVLESFYLDFKLAARQIAKNPVIKYGSGIGVTGVSTESDFSALAAGVASPAAAGKLAESQDIDDQTDLVGSLAFGGNGWQTVTTAPSLSGTVNATLLLDGVIAKPVGT